MKSTERFSDRVSNYVKFRPTYPDAVLETLQRESGLTPAAIIADIGAGTGILTRLLLENGNHVFAIEPNDAMRGAAEASLSKYDGFTSVAGTAEHTTLEDNSVDCIVVAQAFHWFEPATAKLEFARILKPSGWVALVWNTRHLDTTPFLKAYERLLRQFGTDYKAVHHRFIERQTLAAFLGKTMRVYQFPHSQMLDYGGLEGRLLSSSYIPNVSHPEFPAMIKILRQIFDRHSTQGRISFDYDTDLYLAQWR